MAKRKADKPEVQEAKAEAEENVVSVADAHGSWKTKPGPAADDRPRVTRGDEPGTVRYGKHQWQDRIFGRSVEPDTDEE